MRIIRLNRDEDYFYYFSLADEGEGERLKVSNGLGAVVLDECVENGLERLVGFCAEEGLLDDLTEEVRWMLRERRVLERDFGKVWVEE